VVFGDGGWDCDGEFGRERGGGKGRGSGRAVRILWRGIGTEGMWNWAGKRLEKSEDWGRMMGRLRVGGSACDEEECETRHFVMIRRKFTNLDRDYSPGVAERCKLLIHGARESSSWLSLIWCVIALSSRGFGSSFSSVSGCLAERRPRRSLNRFWVCRFIVTEPSICF
jgi:hypothetical protein